MKSTISTVLCLAFLPWVTSSDTLYAGVPDVHSFQSEMDLIGGVFNGPTAWMVEFYQSTCGACQAFAPKFSYHATDVKAWSSIIKIGALDCADRKNVDICRQFGISSVPDIRFFPAYQRNSTPPGSQLFTGLDIHAASHDRSALRQAMIDTVRKQVHPPPQWPQLDFSSSGSQRPALDEKGQYGVVFQDAGSYLGAELFLDLLLCPSVKVHVVQSKEVATTMAVDKFPSLMVWNGKESTVLSNCSRVAGRDMLLALCGRVHHPAAEPAVPGQVEPPATLAPPGVYMADLVSTLAFIVHREVALQPVIHGSSLTALSQFLQAVHYCLPLPQEVRQFVVNMLRHLKLQGRSRTLPAITWTRIKSVQSSSSHLPHDSHWVGCAGSVSGKRGYPCGLWTLFHTLTSHCALMADGKPVRDLSHDGRTLTRRRVAGVNGRWALLAVRDYVEHFFGCADCRTHFLEMSHNMAKEVTTNHEAVMWLWKAHNKVNHRLSSVLTVDPLFPKVQFPGPALCERCQVSTTGGKTEWDESAVLAFLLNFYGPHGVHWSKEWPQEEDSKSSRTVSINLRHPDLPRPVYFVALCMLSWILVMVYFRRRPLPWRYASFPKAKAHMV